MPLQTSTDSPSTLLTELTSSATSTKPSFLIIYASHVNGSSWCGDCRNAEPLVEDIFSEDIDVKVAYVGNQQEWRDSQNVWKKEPFAVERLPTLVKVTVDGNLDFLVEEDVYDQKKLNLFVKGA